MVVLAAGSLSPYISLVNQLSTLKSVEMGTDYFSSRNFDSLGIVTGLLTVVSLAVMSVN